MTQTLQSEQQRVLYVTCKYSEVQDILVEIEGWGCQEANGHEYVGRTLWFGITDKARIGVILFRWSTPVPARLILSLLHNASVLDFFLYECKYPEYESEHEGEGEEKIQPE